MTAQNDAPTLAAVTATTYTDAAGNDSFAALSGALNNNDPDNDPLIYGVDGGTAGSSTNIGGTLSDVSRISTSAPCLSRAPAAPTPSCRAMPAVEALKPGRQELHHAGQRQHVKPPGPSTLRSMTPTTRRSQQSAIGACGPTMGAISRPGQRPRQRRFHRPVSVLRRRRGRGSGYFWTTDVGQRAADAYITIDADDLAAAWLHGGQVDSSELISVRAFNGSVWSDRDPFTLTTSSATPGPNAPPVVDRRR